MKKIASHSDVDIFAPDNSRFSFLKSPYEAHKTGSAVDIYYGDFGKDAFSPVDGRIIDIKSYDTPTPFKNWNSKEYVIAIRQNNYVIKILHIKPDISSGEMISKGDKIGTFIHNGYFIFWNDPVMHVEVRQPEDYLRASNHHCLTPNIKWKELSSCKNVEFRCRVKNVNKRYSLLFAPHETCGDIRGFVIDGGFLDGYISSSRDDGFFGIIKMQAFYHSEVMSIDVTKEDSKIECGGVAFSLSFDEPLIKLIPRKYGDKLLSEDDEVNIKLEIK